MSRTSFWAGLTDNQPVAYLREISRLGRPAVLLVVVPAAREQTIWRELLARLNAAGISSAEQAPPAGVVFSATTEVGPIIALTSWPRVLSAIEVEVAGDQRVLADLTQLRALCDAADRQAFAPLSAEDISDQRHPDFFLNVGTVI